MTFSAVVPESLGDGDRQRRAVDLGEVSGVDEHGLAKLGGQDVRDRARHPSIAGD